MEMSHTIKNSKTDFLLWIVGFLEFQSSVVLHNHNVFQWLLYRLEIEASNSQQESFCIALWDYEWGPFSAAGTVCRNQGINVSLIMRSKENSENSLWGRERFGANVPKRERRWTIIALRNLIFYFWSNIELTLHECSFMSQITNYKEKM